MARDIAIALVEVPYFELSFSCRCFCQMVSWGRNRTSTAGSRLSPSVWCVRDRHHHSQRDVSPDPLCDRKLVREKRDFFSGTSRWRDYRSEKVNSRYSDFRENKTQEGLWIMDNLTSPQRVKGELASERHVLQGPISCRKMMIEKLWRELFSNPFGWWDNRSEKVNPRYPDFRNKKTQQALWVIDNMTPPWVEAELAKMAPGLLQSDMFSWNVRLRRHLKAKDYQTILNLSQQMEREGMIPDKFTFVPIVNACSNLRSLEEGRRVHQQIIQRGCESDIYVANSLLAMYVKCRSIGDAWRVFSCMRKRSVISWTAMIVGYVKAGQGLKALEVFREMQREGVEPDAVTFLGALNACAGVAALEEGRLVHERIIWSGYESDVFVATCLVDMYAKCGSIEDARNVFDKMRERDVASWSAMIVGYVKSDQGLKALELFQQMQQQGVEPNTITFVGALNACASIGALEEGRRVHEQIICRGCHSDVHVATCLVDMYAKCGSIDDAWHVFNQMWERDVVSWTAMIVGYVKSEQGLKALEIFRQMQQEGVEPDSLTFVGALNACSSVVAIEEGRRVHEQISRRGWESNVYVATCLVDMYAKCGSIEDAWTVFNNMRERDVVCWSAMIVSYVKSEQGLKALELFQKMQQEGVEPNTVTFIGVLSACASVAALEEGRCVHKQITQRGCGSDVFVANCLVDMYAKCGSIADAWSVFNKMREHSVVSWNAMIGGYLKLEQGVKALGLFSRMQQEGVEPDPVTFVLALSAYTSVAALEEGRHVHRQIIQRGFESDIYVANCLIDMYAKCGSIEDAWCVFDKMQERDVVSWSAMIAGYVKSEQGLKALQLFQTMQQNGMEPNTLTFVAALNACASATLRKEGKRVHKQIIQRNYESDVYVANCLVDMYAKCGSIKDARRVFNKIRERNVVSWSAMIGGYAMHGDPKKAIELFKRMRKEAVEIDEIIFTCLLSACSHGGLVEEGLRYFKTMTSCYNICPTREHYVCMVDILGRAGRLKEAEGKAEEMMKRMPLERDSSVWRCLLGACRSHGNIEMGERAAKRCWELDPENASAHVLLSNIYAAAGKWDKGAAIEQQRLKKKVWKVPGRTWIEVKNEVHSFLIDDKEHPESVQICAELDSLLAQLYEQRYLPSRWSMPSTEEKDECNLCGHSEELAMASLVVHSLSAGFAQLVGGG